MAEESQQKIETTHTTTPVVEPGVEAKDRGLFDFLGRKEEKPQEEVLASEFGEKVKVSETEEHKVGEEKQGSLLEKLHRTDSSSSSSSDEEERVGEEKKEKKKKQHEEDITVPVEKVDDPAQSEEKKGFLEKVKEKLPGHSKKAEEVSTPPPPPPSTEPAETFTTEAAHEGDAKEKKGFLEKIKEKLPGYHAKTEEEKEKEKESASH